MSYDNFNGAQSCQLHGMDFVQTCDGCFYALNVNSVKWSLHLMATIPDEWIEVIKG